jgi:hypothetical protein
MLIRKTHLYLMDRKAVRTFSCSLASGSCKPAQLIETGECRAETRISESNYEKKRETVDPSWYRDQIKETSTSQLLRQRIKPASCLCAPTEVSLHLKCKFITINEQKLCHGECITDKFL